MTLEQMYYFIEVYRLKSITLAAESLYISRQTLSATIKKIENEFQVALFIRSKYGVEPTEVGEAFYHSVKKILMEVSVLNQNMIYYASLCSENALKNKKKAESVKIDLCKALIHVYGDDLYRSLKNNFSHVAFDVISSSDRSLIDFYLKRDVTVAVIQENELFSYQRKLDDRYIIRIIKRIPLYIWLSKEALLNKENSLKYCILKKYPFCMLKGVLNGLKMASYMGYDLEDTNRFFDVELVSNFYDYVNYFGYYTVDLPLNHQKLFHEQLFANDSKICCKKTSEFFLLVVLYNKLTASDYYSTIIDCLNS